MGLTRPSAPRRALRPRVWIRGAPLLAALALVLPSPAGAQSASEARLALADDPERGEIVITLGPMDLPAGAGHHGGPQPGAQEVSIPRAGWLRGYTIELVDRHGNTVPQQTVHHVNIILPEHRELFSQIMLRVGAAGEETKPVVLPRILGFKVRKGERVLVKSMLHNPTGTTYEGVQLRIRMPFVDADTWLPPLSVYPFYMDVMPPAGIHAYDLPPGKSHKSWEARPAVAARILGVGGHLHTYGTLLRLEDVTANKVLWEARPEKDASGAVVGMPTGKFYWRGGIKIEPGHVYRLTAFYDNPTGRTIPDGAMGALGGVVVAGGSAWPGIDRKHPEYRRDVEITYGPHGRGAAGEHDAHKAAPPAAGTPHKH